MRKIYFLLLTAALALGAAACQRVDADSEPEPVYASVASDVGRDPEGVDGGDTKSLISVSVEDFRKAILFAFNPSTGKVLTYGTNAPSDLQGKPVIVETTEASFAWHLPLKTAMTVYALVNYGSLDMSSYISKGANLTKSDLDAITFSCTSSAELQKLETQGQGLPMSGVLDVSSSLLTTGTETLSIKVKKLFARYHLYLDLGDLEATNASVVMEHAMIYNMNTTVHYFGSGDASTVSRVSTVYDRATDGQLEVLQRGGNSNQVVFYVLENLQGNISGASSWSTVYGDLGSDKLKYCTFLSLSVMLTDNDGRAESRLYRIYLGKTDMKSNFDVPRNYDKTIKLKITDVPPLPSGYGSYFYFTDSNHERDYSVISLAPGESVTLYFNTDFQAENIGFSFLSSSTLSAVSYLTASDKTLVTSAEGLYQGSVKVTASSSATVGAEVNVKATCTGGLAEVSAVRRMVIATPTVLDVSAVTAPTYVGAAATYRVTGLKSGETVTGFSVATASSVSSASYSGTTLTVVPDRASTSYTVTTSQGRTKTFTVTASVPKLKGHGTYTLSLEGTQVYPSSSYVDPTTGATLASSRFDSSFYNAYMAPVYALTNSVGSNLVQYIGYLRTYTIAGFQSYADANNFDQVVATLKVSAKNLAAITSVTDDIKLQDPFPSKETYPNKLDVMQVAASGSRDSNYLNAATKSANGGGSSAPGYTESVNYTGNPVSWGRTVSASALTGFKTQVNPGIQVITAGKTSDTAYTCLISSRADKTYEFSGWLQMGVKNSASGSILYCPAVRFYKRVHLAIGGVKTGPTSDNTAKAKSFLATQIGAETNNDGSNYFGLDGSGGYRTGFFGGCDFAVANASVGGNTLAVMNTFVFSGTNGYRVRTLIDRVDRASRISPQGTIPPMYMATIPTGDMGGSTPKHVGIRNGFFAFVFYTGSANIASSYNSFQGSDPDGYGMGAQSAPFTLATDAAGTRETYGIVLNGGDIIVHDYSKLYPSSRGWLPSTYNYTPVYPSTL